ncbi:MAG: hypothetical protein LJE94_03640 [Deltaproteobacteria bacterium]|nr:hypothetical protein [Deltaproteobacteria bacterium]
MKINKLLTSIMHAVLFTLALFLGQRTAFAGQVALAPLDAAAPPTFETASFGLG